MLKPETIKELQKILKEEFCVELNFKDSSEIATRLVKHYSLLAKLKNKKDDEEQNQKT